MYIDEEKRLDALVAEIPVGGVFKSISGQIFMKIYPQSDNRAVDLVNGIIHNFPSNTEVEYFKNAKVFLKH